MKDPYLYPNSETLKNLFNKTDETKFSAIEADYTSLTLFMTLFKECCRGGDVSESFR